MGTTSTEAPAGTGLELTPVERTVLAEEVASFAGTLADPASREHYEQLAVAAREGVVPSALIGFLEALLELVLPTQRVRRRHGPEAERALLALFFRTPRGARLRQAADEVNGALAALRGQALERLAFTPTPGGHRLAVDTEACRLSLVIDRAGIRIEHLDLAGG